MSIPVFILFLIQFSFAYIVHASVHAGILPFTDIKKNTKIRKQIGPAKRHHSGWNMVFRLFRNTID